MSDPKCSAISSRRQRRQTTNEKDKETKIKIQVRRSREVALTLVVPLHLGVSSDDGAQQASLRVVGLEVRLGSDGSHVDVLSDAGQLLCQSHSPLKILRVEEVGDGPAGGLC